MVTVTKAIGLSGSVPVSGMVIGANGSSDPTIGAPIVAVGLSLMPLMLIVKVVLAVPPLPSEIV